MTWNYRIFKHRDLSDSTRLSGYGLHEAYYDEHGKMDGWTENHFAWGDSPDEVIRVLEMMLNDAKKCKNDIPDFKKE